MSGNIGAIIVLWVILIIVMIFVMLKTMRWSKMPKTTAVITGCEIKQKIENRQKKKYWEVTYKYVDLQKNEEQVGVSRWYGIEDPVIGQEIEINYDSKRSDTLIAGTYNMKASLILVFALFVFGLVMSLMLAAGFTRSRR